MGRFSPVSYQGLAGDRTGQLLINACSMPAIENVCHQMQTTSEEWSPVEFIIIPFLFAGSVCVAPAIHMLIVHDTIHIPHGVV